VMQPMMMAAGLAALAYAGITLAADGAEKSINMPAVSMFVFFVLVTLGITWWAAKRTRTAKDFYTAGGGITGFQNGLALAGDYMSAASFLGIAGLVYANGFDGLIYSIGFLVGWPIMLFLLAEKLRNLGKYTFADVASYRLSQVPVRTVAAVASLVVVAMYLIAQMVGAGKLIEVLFGLPYTYAVVIVGVLMILYVLRRHAGHHLGADHQGRAAALRRHLHGPGRAVCLRLRLQRHARQGGRDEPEA